MHRAKNLTRTGLYKTHVALGGRMVPFGGWEMPIQYSSILDEARGVRSRAGLFDVSHMGRIDIFGPDAAELLNRVLSIDVPKIRIGRSKYNVICDERGGIIDDCIVYRRENERYLLIPNASNTQAVLRWLRQWSLGTDQLEIVDVTTSYAMIAYQGPRVLEMLCGLLSIDPYSLRPFTAVETSLSGVNTFVARTGYTGEDGVELIIPQKNATEIWELLMTRGAMACGLGARDVLRLEAGLLLHGNDMDASTNPYEAGLDKFVNPDREDYVAGRALRTIRESGVSRKLVGFNLLGRGIPRHSHTIIDGGVKIGAVSSGGYSPTLDRSIGMGYVPIEYSSEGSGFSVDIRGRLVRAEVTSLPFYIRSKAT